MREDMLFQERCFTLRVNGEPAEQILCSRDQDGFLGENKTPGQAPWERGR